MEHKTTYHKLVRDNIPAIIRGTGKTCLTRILSEEEYLRALNAKLEEELAEYLATGDIEELADLEEVLRAVLETKGISYEEFETLRAKKKEERGGFCDRVLLESVSG